MNEDDEHLFRTPLESKVKDLLTPFQQYINSQVTASIFLLSCTLIALVWASMPSISAWYTSFVHVGIGIHVSDYVIKKPLEFWVNDVLLTFFFFFVGLEIKREFLVGELMNVRRAAFVFFAAVGGMVVPALIYYWVNAGSVAQHGWGIPMATDTAFALGILSCFKSKLPKGAFTFLAALAIIDDISAIVVIAIFYTQHVSVPMLLIAFAMVLILFLFNSAGFRKPLPYIVVGLVMWVAIEAAGIHGTLAGILVAFMIPARPAKRPKHFIRRVSALLKNFEKRKNKTALVLEDEKQHMVLEEVEEIAKQATTPLQRWEGKLELPIALVILPLFALVNAGIPVRFDLIDHIFTHRISLGILFGLCIGKPLGVLLMCRIALWLNCGNLPDGVAFKDLLGVSILTGIGFTMSLFISNIAFPDPNQLLLAKAAILLASIMSGIVGAVVILSAKPPVAG